MNTIIVRDNPDSTPQNIREFGALYHQKDSTHITWLLDHPVLAKRHDLKTAVMEFSDKYGDEVTLFNYSDPIRFDQETLNRRMDECIEELARLTGRAPTAIGSWVLNSATAGHAVKKHSIRTAIGQVWEQLGVDGYSGVGSINGPYYPSKRHFMLPAQAEDDLLDIVILDAVSCDMIDTRIPKTARTTIHPWDSHLTAFDAAPVQRHITAAYLKHNLAKNPFGWLVNTVELDWMFQAYLTYNKNGELRRLQHEWLTWLYETFSEASFSTLTEFRNYFRKEHPDNSRVIYRFEQNSIFNPQHNCYWFFSRNFRCCVEYTDEESGSELIVLDSKDFREQGQWADGYDTACYNHAAYPEEKVRTTPVINRRDTAAFTVRKEAEFCVWILSDGTEASDIEVIIDGASAGIAGGTRGSDDWYCLKTVRLSCGEHTIELVNRYNKKGPWFAVYAQVLLAAEAQFKPALGRIIETDPFLKISDYTDYRTMNPCEPEPPAENWSLPSDNTSWKLGLPAIEVFRTGRRFLRLSEPHYKRPAAVLDRRPEHEKDKIVIAQTRLREVDDGSIAYTVRLAKLTEAGSSVRLLFHISESGKLIMKKEIHICPQEIRCCYQYEMVFDELSFSNGKGSVAKTRPPREIIYSDKGVRVIH